MPKLPPAFSPIPTSEIKEKLPPALEFRYGREEMYRVAINGHHPRHVFDSYHGVRIVVAYELTDDDQEDVYRIHASASDQTGMPQGTMLYALLKAKAGGALTAIGLDMERVVEEMLGRTGLVIHFWFDEEYSAEFREELGIEDDD